MQDTVYLSLGTNLGDRLENLRQAASALTPALEITRLSPIYITAPWGYTDQPEFLNQVVEGRTDLSPEELLHFIKDLEEQLGRQPSFRYGPRLIDLDILFYGSQVVEQPGLRIPHPRLAERAFVLVPLADLAPDLMHTVLGKTIGELLMKLDREGVQLYLDPNQGE
jgi:2-amino-4-hydroxy-6-hydroxymethyldihydropteridine diphosphokinase